MSRRLTRLVAVAALALLPVAAPAPAHAAGSPGYCTSDSGTTVVVDMTDLGGDVIVRCSPKAGSGTSGVEALRAAGFTVAGTAQSGDAFVCRVSGRPAADEELAVQGDDGYTEDCQDTPPRSAFWTYWSAKNGGSWKYSTTGAASRQTVAGDFEGWRFALNDSDPPAPAAKPTRPGSSTPSSTPTPKPTRAPGGGSTPTTPGSSTPTPATSPTAEAGKPDNGTEKTPKRERKPEQKKPRKDEKKAKGKKHDNAAADSGVASPSDGPTTTGELPQATSADTNGSGMTTLLGLGALAVLALGAGGVAWRRSRSG